MIEKLNDFRRYFGKDNLEIDGTQNEWCTRHCWSMASQGKLFHAIHEYLGPWSEVVVMCNEGRNWNDTVNKLMDLISGSYMHREIILKSRRMGYGIISHMGNAYLTIRGI